MQVKEGKKLKADMQALNPQRTSGFSGCNLSVFCVITVEVCASVCVRVCPRDFHAFTTDRRNRKYKKLSKDKSDKYNTAEMSYFPPDATNFILFIILLGYICQRHLQ